MNWDDVKILLAIGRTGGLSRTAKLLGVSVSTVHRRAAELEHSLNATLFSRGSDGYALTDAGRNFFAIAEQAEEHMTALERHELSGRQSVLRIALPELLGQQLLLPDLGAFRAKHSNFRIEISTTVVPAEFSRREADIAVRLVRPESGRYLVKRIGRIGFGLFCSPTYLEATPELNTVADLAHHSLIGWDRELQYVFLSQWMRDLTKGAAPSLSFDSLNAQMLAVQAGFGIAIMPSYLSTYSNMKQVLPNTTFEQDIWLMRHRDTGGNPRAGEACAVIERALSLHKNQLIAQSP